MTAIETLKKAAAQMGGIVSPVNLKAFKEKHGVTNAQIDESGLFVRSHGLISRS